MEGRSAAGRSGAVLPAPLASEAPKISARTRFLIRRVLIAIPVMLAVSIAVFAILRLLPGDPARLLAGPTAPPSAIADIRANLGLDQPLPIQFVTWLTHVLRGDLGLSVSTRTPVLPQVADAFLNSLELALAGMLLALSLGIPLGVLAARYRGSAPDWVVSAISIVGISVPIFWVGILLVIVFAVDLRVLPATGKTGLVSFVLPACTIAIYEMAFVIRMTRAATINALDQPYITTARAKGVRDRDVYFVHALRNALVPVVTLSVVQFGYLLGGAAVTETVFVWPGIGRLLIDAIARRDYAVIQGAVLFIAAAIVLLYLAADVLHSYLDPRIRL
jgi:peptide/nickel transport system permease protein